MAKKVRVYLTRTCITSRRAVDYLKKKEVEVEAVDYCKMRLMKDQIAKLLKLAGVRPKDALRRKDKMYKELDLANRALSDDEVLKLMEKHPGLIQRPIVVVGDKAAIARETSKIDALL